MTSESAVLVKDLWEEFRISEDRALSVKEVLSRFRFSRATKNVWALKGIDLRVAKGETVGLIGENGSGKSTLLRCMAGILPPTRGEVLVRGRVSSLIELGAGFHPELTGRENVMVSAALFGLTRFQALEGFDTIVSFAELGEVIDQPVRSYSSGMQVRLAFSLAVHVNPDVLLVDEVLAVGDESFQRKCIARIQAMAQAGVTVVFVSHDLWLVKQVCRRCIFLHQGRLLADGDPASVIDHYREAEQLPESVRYREDDDG